MTLEPVRWKDSADLDDFARDLLGASRPTSPLPHAARLRGGRRVALLAAAPAAALGVGLWAKVVAAAFGAGFASALALVTVSPRLQEGLFHTSAATAREARNPPAADGARETSGALAPESAVRAGEPTGDHESPPSSLAPQLPPPASRSSMVRHPTDGSRPSGAPTPVAPTEEAQAPLALSGLGVGSTAAMPIASGSALADDRMSAEVRLLGQARLLVSSDPNQALELLNRHARLFPDASLAMEREMLVIEALRHSGRAKEAAERAAQLLAASPNALYAARLKRMIEQR